ncbi:MAG: type II secretion system protein [Candidatus Hydrogenedentes bacterium]|nr:type II secretion system protein [Candidatus Hydrogenedentota bacterium]
MTTVIRARKNAGQSWSAGFTLMEIIVALAVIAVASSIAVTMFGGSYKAGREVVDRRVAQQIAESVLDDLQRNPASYKWPAATADLQLVERQDGTTNVASPAVTVPNPNLQKTIDTQYERYTVRSYVKLYDASPNTCELTTVVSWERAKRALAITLTALAPKRVLEGKP